MSNFDTQEPFIDAEFEDVPTALIRVPDPRLSDNVEPRCPCVLLLDNSGSMYGQSINELNAGLKQLKEELQTDSLARKRVEIALVSFGSSVEVVSEFQTVDDFVPPKLEANGMTPMGEAITKGIDMLEIRKAQIKYNGIKLYRPWIFLLTDGAPTDNWKEAAERVRKGEAAKKFVFFPVGVSGYNKQILSEISVREPVRLLDSTKFRDLFRWISSSLSSVSSSQPGDEIRLSNPTAPGGWGVID
jgi:uncharacterized protein YegL